MNFFQKMLHHITPTEKKCADDSAQVDRGGSWTAATSKMERFVIIVNG